MNESSVKNSDRCEGGVPITSEPCPECGATENDLCGDVAKKDYRPRKLTNHDMIENALRQIAASANETGVLISIGCHTDDQGRNVLRAIVDFYDGNCPPITFGTVWSQKPVTIVEVPRTSPEGR